MSGDRESGFTLVEMLIALMIFGMLAGSSVVLLGFAMRAQETADTRLDGAAALRRLGALMGADLAQAAPRINRAESGEMRPAFIGTRGEAGQPLLAFVRRGWDHGGADERPAIQKVEYRLTAGRLERVAWPMVDGAAPMEPVALVDGVRGLRLRFRDEAGNWHVAWNPEDPTLLPRAVELALDLGQGHVVRQLFLAGSDL
ncbi:MAG: type II secretion system minor pseudopilin GspJ [Allosphingosinicella sp.]|uniref:type II secretion system minor pseudopilin GspJ n=1 Tax=Allosphingosinicella sp. TaxID=2823234 RepID=UPI00394E8F29